MFYKAALVMGAGTVDTFPPPVGNTGKVAVAKQVAKPAGEVSSKQVSICCCHGPACQHAQGNGNTGWARGRGINGFFHVQQAKVIFPPFAQYDLLAMRCGVGVKSFCFLLDLALQMACVCADPDRAIITFRP